MPNVGEDWREERRVKLNSDVECGEVTTAGIHTHGDGKFGTHTRRWNCDATFLAEIDVANSSREEIWGDGKHLSNKRHTRIWGRTCGYGHLDRFEMVAKKCGCAICAVNVHGARDRTDKREHAGQRRRAVHSKCGCMPASIRQREPLKDLRFGAGGTSEGGQTPVWY